MTPFELAEPRSLAEAIALLDTDDPSVRPIAGGTALMLMMKAGVFKPERLISLRGIEGGHSRIEATAGGLRIGAMATLRDVERSDAVGKAAPVLIAALRTLSNVRVRNVATIGGHLAHADPHMDLPPVLIAIGAGVSITGPMGTRSLPVEELFTGYYETALTRGELITEVIIPPQDTWNAYLKCTTRAAHDWPALGVAVALGQYGHPRIVISAAVGKPTRCMEAEAILGGGAYLPFNLACAAEAAAQAAKVETDERGSAAFKRQLIRVYVERALNQALVSNGVIL